MAVFACNLSTWDMVLGGSEIQGHPQLHGEFEASLAYTRPCFKIIISMFCHFPWAEHSHGVGRHCIKDLCPDVALKGPAQPALHSFLDSGDLEGICSSLVMASSPHLPPPHLL